jgi:hypothetical protein
LNNCLHDAEIKSAETLFSHRRCVNLRDNWIHEESTQNSNTKFKGRHAKKHSTGHRIERTLILVVSFNSSGRVDRLQRQQHTAALSGRSARSFANKRIISESSVCGNDWLCQLSATGGVLMCCPIIAISSSPRNGGLPVTISYSIAPSEYKSDLEVISPPVACSGGI